VKSKEDDEENTEVEEETSNKKEFGVQGDKDFEGALTKAQKF